MVLSSHEWHILIIISLSSLPIAFAVALHMWMTANDVFVVIETHTAGLILAEGNEYMAKLCLLHLFYLVQERLFAAVHAVGKPTIVVLIHGGALAIETIKEEADGIIDAFYPGVEAGPAVAEVLFGDTNPSGKLPFSVRACIWLCVHARVRACVCVSCTLMCTVLCFQLLLFGAWHYEQLHAFTPVYLNCSQGTYV